jgi:rod shape-determining protein MreD
MKNWIFFLIIVVLGILQVTILNYFKILGVKPDLLLISAVFASLVFEFKWAFVLSVFAGMFKDIFGASAFGINTLLFSLWSFLIVRLNKEITIDYNFIRMALIFIISVVHNTISGLVLVYSGSFIPAGLFLGIVFLQSIYTALVLPLMFKINEPFFLKNG